MIFNSFQFLYLFPIIFAGYYGISYIIGKREQGRSSNILLLLMSYALYMQWDVYCTLVLFWVTLATFIGALFMDGRRKTARTSVWLCVVLAFIPLTFFKYHDFIADNLNAVFPGMELSRLNWAIPLGLSFYSFQAVGYLIDVYKQRIRAERNFWDYALFVSFFPQILSGPISKASELLPQIKAKRKFNHDKAVQGLKWLLWGMFMKVVLANRLGLYVDVVYDNYIYQSGLSCLMASLLYSFQIYGDFAGYSLMAMGVGHLMGFDLVNNFNRPYFASSITEFWRRWHISLTRWLTTYVYIGLGGNRCSKFRQYLNIMLTFLVSGIWHGANWTFILWGIVHGILQCMEKFMGLDPKGKYTAVYVSHWQRLFRILMTFLLVNLAFILFRLPNIGTAVEVFKKIFTMEGSELFLPNNSTIAFILMSLVLVSCKEICEEYHPCIWLFNHHKRYVRWGGYIVICVLIMLCGVFDSGQFIYVQF